jgi:hypothetical protein
MSAKSIALFNAHRAAQGRPVAKPVNIRGTVDKSAERAAVAKAWLAAQARR